MDYCIILHMNTVNLLLPTPVGEEVSGDRENAGARIQAAAKQGALSQGGGKARSHPNSPRLGQVGVRAYKHQAKHGCLGANTIQKD